MRKRSEGSNPSLTAKGVYMYYLGIVLIDMIFFALLLRSASDFSPAVKLRINIFFRGHSPFLIYGGEYIFQTPMLVTALFDPEADKMTGYSGYYIDVPMAHDGTAKFCGACRWIMLPRPKHIFAKYIFPK